MANTEKLLRLTIMQVKNPKLSDEEFHKHWSGHHAPLASAWLARNGIIGYSQYHTSTETRQMVAGLADSIGAAISPFDSYVEFMVRSVDDLIKASQDPEYPVKMQPDEKYMFDHDNMQMTVGWVEAYIEDGKVVNIVDGKSAFL